MPRSPHIERRTVTGNVEVRSEAGKPKYIEGYAAVFGKRSQDLGGFVEVVENTAFNKTVKEADVRALLNHDANMVLGRNRSGTLDLSVDNSGLYYRALPPNTQYAHDLLELLERGDVDQSSFSFRKVHDRWALTEEDMPERSLMEVSLIDVSPVTYPAYLDATSGVSRSAAMGKLAEMSEEEIRAALRSEPDPKWIARQRYAADLERILQDPTI
jgi:HK97 family phage prohead protease